MRTLKVAFLGARHPHVLPRLALCQAEDAVVVTGLYDNDKGITQTISQQYHVPAASNAEELLGEPNLDLVVVDGFDFENPAYVEKAAGRSRMLLIEKPGAPNLDAMERMVDAIRAAGIHAQLGYMYSYSPVVKKTRELLHSGVLGPATLARFHAGAPVGCGAEIWQSLPQDMGGTFFTDGCHMLDLVVHLLGEPKRAYGSVLKLQNGPEVLADIYKADVFSGLGAQAPMKLGSLVHEDVAAAVLEYPTLLATFDVTSWEAHNWVEAWSMEFFGTDGTLKETAVGTGASLVADENYRSEMADIFRRLRDNAPPDLTRLQEGLVVVRVVDAVYRSAGWL